MRFSSNCTMPGGQPSAAQAASLQVGPCFLASTAPGSLESTALGELGELLGELGELAGRVWGE